MKNAYVIIGANDGDEGKGEVTNYLAKTCGDTRASVVIRFNGGAQAGHTVSTKQGQHTFSHFGSGTLLGIPTYLSQYFIVNPLMFMREREKLMQNFDLEKLPTIYVHRMCPVTIVSDILINNAVEKFRGIKKHGTCGVGINETVQRTEESNYGLTVNDFLTLKNSELHDKILSIYLEWVPFRLRQLTEGAVEKLGYETSSAQILQMIVDYKTALSYMLPICDNKSILDMFTYVYFEGAQGLKLDQHSEYFPHVTRSNTGSTNVLHILKDSGYFLHKYRYTISFNYVSRVYLTRHGEGPFDEVAPDFIQSFAIQDETNINNPNQGPFKYGVLNLKELIHRVKKDFAQVLRFMPYAERFIVFTCGDQIIEDKFRYFGLNGKPRKSWKTFCEDIEFLMRCRKHNEFYTFGRKTGILGNSKRIIPFTISPIPPRSAAFTILSDTVLNFVGVWGNIYRLEVEDNEKVVIYRDDEVTPILTVPREVFSGIECQMRNLKNIGKFKQ